MTMMPLFCGQFLRRGISATPLITRAAVSMGSSKAMGPHALHFKIERYLAASMVPLLPAAYFVHGPFMDFALSAAIVVHSHWGVMAVLQDYARPLVIGKTLAKMAPMVAYVSSAVLLVGLLMFNHNSVGLTKAFEMVFSL